MLCSFVLANPQVVEPKKAIVDADVKVAEEAAAAANAIKKECEDALAEAIPILNSAISALDTIKSADIKLVQVGREGGGSGGIGPSGLFRGEAGQDTYQRQCRCQHYQWLPVVMSTAQS